MTVDDTDYSVSLSLNLITAKNGETRGYFPSSWWSSQLIAVIFEDDPPLSDQIYRSTLMSLASRRNRYTSGMKYMTTQSDPRLTFRTQTLVI